VYKGGFFFWGGGWGEVQKSPYFEGKESQKCANVLPYLDIQFRKDHQKNKAGS